MIDRQGISTSRNVNENDRARKEHFRRFGKSDHPVNGDEITAEGIIGI